MSDKHLNLFYSYNRDKELVENNITRAFIVTIKLLSQDLRQMFLFNLLNEPILSVGVYQDASLPSFDNPQFAFQNNIDRSKVLGCRLKYLVALTSYNVKGSESDRTAYDSKPDAWLYDTDEDGGYVFLFEAKIGGNILDARQLKSHAESWLNIDDYREILITITWYDIIRTIEKLFTDPRAAEEKMNEQEREILQALKQYLRYAGYRLFKGFNFGDLNQPPNYRIEMIRTLIDILLENPPKFKFGL